MKGGQESQRRYDNGKKGQGNVAMTKEGEQPLEAEKGSRFSP